MRTGYIIGKTKLGGVVYNFFDAPLNMPVPKNGSPITITFCMVNGGTYAFTTERITVFRKRGRVRFYYKD